MKKYPTPKLFDPTSEQQKEAAIEAAKLFSPNRVLITKSGERIRGTREDNNQNKK